MDIYSGIMKVVKKDLYFMAKNQTTLLKNKSQNCCGKLEKKNHTHNIHIYVNNRTLILKTLYWVT